MPKGLVASVSATINAPISEVWEALVDPAKIKHYMFGTTVVSDWQPGSGIVWKGDWEGKKYEDKGTILDIIEHKLLKYSHFSPLSGSPDKPENYHTVTIELSHAGKTTNVMLTQDNNPTEEAKAQSEKNWRVMLDGLKKFVEK